MPEPGDGVTPRPRSGTYLLPIKRSAAPASAELAAYLAWVAARMPVIVVDGSPAAVFAAHAAAWGDVVRHVPVAPDLVVPNGKVAGVLTGLRYVAGEAVIIADDDVRYDDASLAAVLRALDGADVVRPQNYFAPHPWHAVWDTGRILLNRATGGDWPGTLAVRRAALQATHGYAGDVLFENLELVRTIVAAGGRERVASSVFVRRLPTTTRHFWSQRVRQAYDELARPRRLATQLAILPAAALLLRVGRLPEAAAAAAAMLIAAAEWGRRRDGGRRVFPAAGSVMAPLWVAERAVTAWLAVATRVLRGGVSYAGTRIARAATPMRELRRRHAGAITSTSIGLNVPLFDSSAEHAVTPTTRSISARSSR
ncbi:MAG TPA: glycosyltransferase family 2 protein [Gemmatimonadaceae bacterium]|nr:glycosyltransferase family 2 protein [Gemmatimonadaceae bacterium]